MSVCSTEVLLQSGYFTLEFLDLLVLVVNFVLELFYLSLSCLKLLLHLIKLSLHFLLIANVSSFTLHGCHLLVLLFGQRLFLHYLKLVLKSSKLGEHNLSLMLKLLVQRMYLRFVRLRLVSTDPKLVHHKLHLIHYLASLGLPMTERLILVNSNKAF
jgi:hypothetical protein